MNIAHIHIVKFSYEQEHHAMAVVIVVSSALDLYLADSCRIVSRNDV